MGSHSCHAYSASSIAQDRKYICHYIICGARSDQQNGEIKASGSRKLNYDSQGFLLFQGD